MNEEYWALLKFEYGFENNKKTDIDLIVNLWRMYKRSVSEKTYDDVRLMLQRMERKFYDEAIRKPKAYDIEFSKMRIKIYEKYFSKIPKPYRIVKALDMESFEKECFQDSMGSVIGSFAFNN